MGVTNFDEYRDVFVVADTIDDVVHPVTYELIGQARRIAKELGQLVQAMLLVRMFNPRRRNLWHMVPILFTFLKALF